MELRVLEYFLALAREGSVLAAAEVLHISPPTLSRQLIDLERELGCTLFERGRHGITLTDDRAFLRRRAAEIADLVHIAETEVVLNREVVAGEIRIGCAETRAMDDLEVRPLDVAFDASSYLVWKPFQLRTHARETFLDRARSRWSG